MINATGLSRREFAKYVLAGSAISLAALDELNAGMAQKITSLNQKFLDDEAPDGAASRSWGITEISEKTIGLRSFLSHRGPDDVGLYGDEGIGLAHTRLSIIDLAGGHQPLTNEHRSIFLVANAEIYNHRELRQALAVQGHQFRTASDCEAIVHLYEQYGQNCVEHLEGMFAFALWDSREQSLLLARDRFGIKPLYLARLKDGLCFARS